MLKVSLNLEMSRESLNLDISRVSLNLDMSRLSLNLDIFRVPTSSKKGSTLAPADGKSPGCLLRAAVQAYCGKL